ncbi:hypothetical protein AVEN_86424-1 [Araneus ventricosus]|uniref:Uncharacterized protein n=1 Tax=Araneus ventricosus TaxID=182803 RepID=A0A4Y2IEQ6_ARAVE|nr:hypothetical protein AVEN_86424-1 [Araneus ventricosus]
MKSISRKHPGKNRCPVSERSSSQTVAPLLCFGSEVPIVPTSVQEKGRSLMGQGRMIQYLPSQLRMCSFVLLLLEIFHLRPRTKTLDAYCQSFSLVISVRAFGTHLHFSPALKSELLGRHFRSNEEARQAVKNFLRSLGTDFYQAGFLKLISRYDKCINVGGEYVEK